ncbi:hypothetical protein SDC9_157999 [bioreactor metagenome]|uniref:Uncharacterized protein n=1 Tax=bioreactor metagenome TaxID=1076179 RepID=A0A645FAW7_9ZZZZ
MIDNTETAQFINIADRGDIIACTAHNTVAVIDKPTVNMCIIDGSRIVFNTERHTHHIMLFDTVFGLGIIIIAVFGLISIGVSFLCGATFF